MQNSQEINLWIEIAKLLIPSLITLVVPFITYRWITKKMADYQKDINKEIESYKIELNKELENHKIQLQSDFQTKFHEFQTRYSIYQQNKAAFIEEIYSLLWDIFLIARNLNLNLEEKRQKLESKRFETLSLFEKKRLYLDEIDEAKIENFLDRTLSFSVRLESNREIQDIEEEFRIFAKEELITLKKEFRKILSPENSNNQLVRK